MDGRSRSSLSHSRNWNEIGMSDTGCLHPESKREGTPESPKALVAIGPELWASERKIRHPHELLRGHPLVEGGKEPRGSERKMRHPNAFAWAHPLVEDAEQHSGFCDVGLQVWNLHGINGASIN